MVGGVGPQVRVRPAPGGTTTPCVQPDGQYVPSLNVETASPGTQLVTYPVVPSGTQYQNSKTPPSNEQKHSCFRSRVLRVAQTSRGELKRQVSADLPAVCANTRRADVVLAQTGNKMAEAEDTH